MHKPLSPLLLPGRQSVQGVSFAACLTSLLVITLGQTATLIAELDIAMGLVGLPSNYAKDMKRQAELANGTVFNCYRSGQWPVPLALLYPEFDDFCLRCASPACMTVRDGMFCAELCQKMQHFSSREMKRELAFGTLFREYLQGQLPSDISMTHQTRGKNIFDIQLQVKVGIGHTSAMHAKGSSMYHCLVVAVQGSSHKIWSDELTCPLAALLAGGQSSHNSGVH